MNDNNTRTKFLQPSGNTWPSYHNAILVESRRLENELREAFLKTGEVPPSKFAQEIAAKRTAKAPKLERK